MLLNFFSQETILSVRLHLINTKRCRQLPGPGPFFPLFSARWFAYENRIYWLCGQSYANRAGSSAAPGCLSCFFRPGGLRTKTDFIGFAGRRTQTVPAAVRSRAAFSTFPGPVVCVRKPNLLALRAGVRKPCRQQLGPGPPFSLFSARWFAYENRFYWLCGQAYANRAGTRAACFLCAARSRHQYAWRMASMMFSAPTTEIPARVNLLFFFGRIIFS